MSGVGEALAHFWSDSQPRAFVAGEWVAAGATAPSYDPSTGEELAAVPYASAAEVDAAVEAARGAQPAWSAAGLEARADALELVEASLRAHGEKLALLDSADSGNPLASARRDIGLALRYLKRWPSFAFALAGRATTPAEDALSYTLRTPYGVVGKIIAFNHPTLFALGGMIFPLLAGNTMVIKAAPQTPLATLAIGRVLADVLPPGVVNIVAGGAETGDALVTHPAVKRIAFTGSLPTALAIQSRLGARGRIKHLTTELGGKNAMVVFPDVDLDAAVEAAVAGMSFTVSQGQSCQSTSRLLLHESIHDDFVTRLAERLRRLRVGVAYDEGSDMGPLVSLQQLDRVRGYVASGCEEGAELVTGGGVPDGVPPRGYYLEPTLFTGVTPRMRIAREEIFGPVVAAMTWSDHDEMLRLANDVDLGLSAAVWCRDIDLALRTAHELEAGYVWVNDANRHFLGAPFGGVKNSGVGREECLDELLSYFETKAVNVRVPRRLENPGGPR
ncbi:aldehyde dehydrogenase family protein [Microbispora sp. NPDC046933]|uniref:aldehyde dehydrogenase family protein n=1 Tax=Microbispora sp. NPDC046933 TaxID=3155618 RepID=UPI0033CCACE5